MVRRRRQLSAGAAALALALCLAGCGRGDERYTDPQNQVTVTYPAQLTLVSEQAALEKSFALAVPGRGQTPQLSFALQLGEFSSATCAVQLVPGQAEFTAQTYFAATTARELDVVGAEIVEPPSEVRIQGKSFQQVGFVLGEGRSRIYEHYDPTTRRVVIFSLTTRAADWDRDAPLLEAVAQSLQVHWPLPTTDSSPGDSPVSGS